MEETNKRFEERTDRYRQNFKKYGYSEMSMDMPSDRRVIRYLKRNFTTDDISDLEFDYAVSSQTFTIPYTEKPDNYETIFSSVENCLNSAEKVCLSTFSRIKASSSALKQPIMIRWRSCGSRILYPPM